MKKVPSFIILSLWFLAGEVTCGIVAAFIKIYWLKLMDPKFFDAPLIAFQIELFGILFLFIISTMCLWVSFLFKKKHLIVSRRQILRFAILGTLYPILFIVIGIGIEHVVNDESIIIPVISLFYVIGYPVFSVFYSLARR